MNKLFTKITSLALGAAMMIGVGVSVGSNSKATTAEATSGDELTFDANSSLEGDYDTAWGYAFTKGANGNAPAAYSDGIRVYNAKGTNKYGGHLTLSPSATNTNGYITSVVITVTTKYNPTLKVKAGDTESSMSSATESSLTDSSSAYTYTPSGTSTRYIEFTSWGNNSSSYTQWRVKKLVINYTIPTGQTVTAVAQPVAGNIFVKSYSNVDDTTTWDTTGLSAAVTVEGGGSYTGTITYSFNPAKPIDYATSGATSLSITATAGGITSDALVINDMSVSAAPGYPTNPFTVAQARAYIDTLGTASSPERYVSGIISQIDRYNATYKSITYWISDDGTTTNQLEVYSGKNINGADFEADTDLTVGDVVTVKGTLKLYDSIYEFNHSSQIVTRTAVTVSSISVKTAPNKVLYYAGEFFDPTGLVITATMSNSKTKDVEYATSSSDFTFLPNTETALSTSDKSVSITYGGKTTSQTITVEAARELVGITLSGTYPTSFEQGDTFSHAGMVVTADYDNDTHETVTAEAEWSAPDMSTTGKKTITVSYSGKTAEYEITVTTPTSITDTLDKAKTGISGTSYAEWSNKSDVSDAVYAGQSGGENSSIQLRSNNSNSGIVTTASGGTIKKIIVDWNENTADGRVLNVYGKNSAYAQATDLYNSSNQGTLLGTIAYGTTTELVVTGDYEYVGVRSNSGAMFLNSIKFVWNLPQPTVTGFTLTDSNSNVLENDDEITIKEGANFAITVAISGSHLTGNEKVNFLYEELELESDAFSFNPASQIGNNETLTITGANGGGYGTLTFTISSFTTVLNLYCEEAKVLEDIEVSGTYKTSYVAGEVFDPDGVVVKAIYEGDETKYDITSLISFPSTALTVSDEYVSISYTEGGVTVPKNIPISVEADYIKSVAFNTSGAKTTYALGSTWVKSETGVTAVGTTYMDQEVNLSASDLNYSGYDLSTTGNQTVTVSYPNPKDAQNPFTTSYTITVKDTIVSTVQDLVNLETLGVSGTSYTEFSNKSASSPAIYEGRCAGGNSAIQLRSDATSTKPASGLISKVSGGVAKKIIVEWESHTSANRTLDIFGSNTPYSDVSDLVSETAVGSIVNGSTTEYTFESNYAYIGLRSNSGAMYLSSVKIIWESSEAADADVTEINNFISENMHLDYTASDGNCKNDSADHWYSTAIAAYAHLSTNAKLILATSSSKYATVTLDPIHKDPEDTGTTKDYTYADVKQRLITWAEKNGKTLTFDQYTGEATVNSIVNTMLFDRLGESAGTSIIIIISVIGVSALGGFFFLRKRKEI